MKTTATKWGMIVTIPETENNGEFVYKLRQVRKINDNEPEEQKLINRLERHENKLTRRFLELAQEMEDAFKSLNTSEDFNKWEMEHKTTFNVYFHDTLDRIERLINKCSFIYAEESNHGYCL